jgi:type IV pilus assembly protein PilO
MAIADNLRSLQEIDFADLDLDNIGVWPLPVKLLVWALVFALLIGGGYFFILQGQQEILAAKNLEETELSSKYKRRAMEAANLEAYRSQMAEIEKNFGVLLGQLPEDTEVPGLLDDISNVGVNNGLGLELVGLQAEQRKEFYVELPITIQVSGQYHDFGAFVSGVAALPRIVTLHDFTVSRKKGRDANASSLQMAILAKTYRYKDD